MTTYGFAVNGLAGLAFATIALGAACNGSSGGNLDGGHGTADACTGLACLQVDCAAQGMPTTSISGTVFAPNGTLPLYGVNVYVPQADPGPLTDGVTCGRCDNSLPGFPLVVTSTDEAGHFKLDNVPATHDLPLIIQVGKWRKRLLLPAITACTDTVLEAEDATLPRRADESGGHIVGVDMPRIAITTGSADALECLARKLGIDDSEFTTDTGTGHVHLYAGNGTDKFSNGFAGGSGAFSSETTLWDSTDPAKLDAYDILFFSCEGGQRPGTKSQAAMNNIEAYSNKGGRIFMSHWHNIWIGGESGHASHGIAPWESVASWNFGAPQDQDNVTTLVDTSTAHGTSYGEWLMNVGASTTVNQVPISGARYTATAIDFDKAERFIYVDPTSPANSAGYSSVTDFQFTTDVTKPLAQRCGKVVFSDMHVSATSTSTTNSPFPTGCDTNDLTPQEKALAFIFFDISTCVGPIN